MLINCDKGTNVMSDNVIDTRTKMGVVLHTVVGTGLESKQVVNTDSDVGGALDRGIIGRLSDGRKVMIGELWAAGIDVNSGEKISLDVNHHSKIVCLRGNCNE